MSFNLFLSVTNLPFPHFFLSQKLLPNLLTGDAVLLTHFVANTTSLQSSDQHWIPICLPDFNDKGFLQAYVSSLKITPHEKAADSGFTLVLVAASSDQDIFRRCPIYIIYAIYALSSPQV